MTTTPLREVFEKRWRTLEKRSQNEKIQLPPKESLWKILLLAYSKGFKCDYCGAQLQIKDSYPYYNVFSFEHKKSIHIGGDNSLENLSVICHRCNIVKGPMTEQTYRDIIKYLPSTIFQRFCNEFFAAGMARELARQGLSKESSSN